MRNLSSMIFKNSRLFLQEQRKSDFKQLRGFLIPLVMPAVPNFKMFASMANPRTNKMVLQSPPAKQEQQEKLQESPVNQQSVAVYGENKISFINYEANNGIEDRLVTFDLASINAQVVSVFDGHGGDKVSDFCALHIQEFLQDFLSKNKNNDLYVNNLEQLIKDALKHTYEKLDNQFYQKIYKEQVALNNKKIKNVGTCALTAVVHNKKVYVANCGDSQAILVSYDARNKDIGFIQLNDRQSVSNPKERQRIQKMFPNDSDIISEGSGNSYYLKGRLQPTRALGDYYLKYKNLYQGKGEFNGPYISSEPEIRIFSIQKKHTAIVVGSDGLWDFIDKQAVAQATFSEKPSEQILNKTLQKIAQMHKKTVQQIKNLSAQYRRTYHDDISIAVVSLAPSSE